MIRALSWENVLLTWAGPVVLLVTAVVVVILWRKERKKRLAFSGRTVLLRPGEQVSDASRQAIDLVRRVVALAEFLAARDVTVIRLASEYGAFGCWSLQLQNGADFDRYAEAVREHRSDWMYPAIVDVFWDGMNYRQRLPGPAGRSLSSRFRTRTIRLRPRRTCSLMWWMDLRNGTNCCAGKD